VTSSVCRTFSPSLQMGRPALRKWVMFTYSSISLLNFVHGVSAPKVMPVSQSAEFLRLSLGFKCDLFTLDKRVRLEERSRDLAEENLKKEIENAVKMLEALAPLCEEDNQAQEIIKKLQKSLQFLSQYAARVASRAEMLGAINQESRVSKAVEVMIQHVENLKRMYAKEHAELEELKQLLLQNERSFSSLGDRGNQEKSLLNHRPDCGRHTCNRTLPLMTVTEIDSCRGWVMCEFY
uniref:LRMP protein n=1 Tax=Malurus cyaneus samueli TaxID=2593467 RepID=A0A8C5TH96_9PASS